MKIILTESQISRLIEQTVQFSPEKIDQFNATLSALIEKEIKNYNYLVNMILSTTLGDIIENEEKYRNISKEIDKKSQIFSNENDKYNKIIDMYYLNEDFPENVKKLEKLNDLLDTLQNNFSSLYYALDDILDAVNTMNELDLKTN